MMIQRGTLVYPIPVTMMDSVRSPVQVLIVPALLAGKVKYVKVSRKGICYSIPLNLFELSLTSFSVKQIKRLSEFNQIQFTYLFGTPPPYLFDTRLKQTDATSYFF